MSTALVEITRSGLVESRHNGFVCVANSRGELIATAGEPDTVTYIRSAAKPLQAINLFFSGAMEHFGFTEKELAIMCSSHYGEDMHREVIYGLLDKMGLCSGDLQCASPLSIKPSYRDEQLRLGLPINETNSDCSGKHCGFLSVCKAKGYPIETYREPDHPMQQELLKIIADMCCIEKEKIHLVSTLFSIVSNYYDKHGIEHDVLKAEFYNQAVTINLTEEVSIEMRIWCGQGSVTDVSLIEIGTGKVDIKDVIVFNAK